MFDVVSSELSLKPMDDIELAAFLSKLASTQRGEVANQHEGDDATRSATEAPPAKKARLSGRPFVYHRSLATPLDSGDAPEPDFFDADAQHSWATNGHEQQQQSPAPTNNFDVVDCN